MELRVRGSIKRSRVKLLNDVQAVTDSVKQLEMTTERLIDTIVDNPSVRCPHGACVYCVRGICNDFECNRGNGDALCFDFFDTPIRGSEVVHYDIDALIVYIKSQLSTRTVQWADEELRVAVYADTGCAAADADIRDVMSDFCDMRNIPYHLKDSWQDNDTVGHIYVFGDKVGE